MNKHNESHEQSNITITEILIWPVRNKEVSRVKATVSITLNNALRINGCRIIEGAKGLFLSYPSEKKPGTDQWFPVVHPVNRNLSESIQEKTLTKYKELLDTCPGISR